MEIISESTGEVGGYKEVIAPAMLILATGLGAQHVGRVRRARNRPQHVEAHDVAGAFPDRIDRRLAVEPRQRAGEDRQLLAGVVADDTDVTADLCGLRHELELSRLHELELLRVVAEEAEVVAYAPFSTPDDVI